MSDAPGRDGSPQPVPELLDVRRADVYKGGALAAHLERRSDGSVAFAYTSSGVRNFGPPVATTLPVSAEPAVSAALASAPDPHPAHAGGAGAVGRFTARAAILAATTFIP